MKLDFRLDKWDALLILTLFCFIALFIVPSLEAGYHNIERSFLAFILEMIIAVPVLLLNVRVLMPYFFVKNRVWWYFPVLVLIIAPLLWPYNGLVYLFYHDTPEILKLHGFRTERIGIFIWMQLRHVTVMSLVLIIRRLVFARQSIQELEREKKMMELALLKSQLNPHFYFNTLNNLYALALRKSDKTPDSILRLSKLMEYVIYDCAEGMVLLQKEIEFIYHYVELEKLRYDKDVKIDVQVSGTHDTYHVLPMVMVQFVENAFKHGLSTRPDDGVVSVRIDITERRLKCIIENTYAAGDGHSTPGIGIENTRKRLEAVYGADGFALDIRDTGERYSVNLTIYNLTS